MDGRQERYRLFICALTVPASPADGWELSAVDAAYAADVSLLRQDIAYTYDNQARLVCAEDGVSGSVTRYTYDSEGRVTMHVKTNKRTNFDSTITYSYNYDEVEVSAVDDISADLVARLKVKGRTFSLSGADLSLYDPSGRLVMHGRGSLTAPSAGLYLLKSDGKTVKVVVK